MKKILLSLVLCAFVLGGCNEAKVDENSVEAVVELPSDEEVVDIFIDNIDVWQEKIEPDTMPNDFGYFMLDLDFDGICELVSSVNDGSGRFSYNSYYKANLEDGTVLEIESPEESSFSSGNDWYIISEDVKLLRNTEDNSLFYYCTDYIRSGYADYDVCFREFSITDGEAVVENVFSEYHNERSDNPEDHIHIYSIHEGDELFDLDEPEYLRKKEEYFLKNVDTNLTWLTVDGYAFEEADDETRRQLLLDSYLAFSYDGI